MFRIVGAFIASLVMHPFSVVHGLEAASTANETAKDETVTASSYEGSYECHLPLNCYAGHGADDLDFVGEVSSVSSCAKSCNEMSDWQCEAFVYMGSQRKCWRKRNINLPACEVGEWNTESSEFITCLRSAPAPAPARECAGEGTICAGPGIESTPCCEPEHIACVQMTGTDADENFYCGR